MTESTRLEFNDTQGRRIVRIDKDVFTIGRRDGNDLQLSDPEISRDHAQIVGTKGQHIIRDLDSLSGSFVNGKRVKERKLVNFDRLRFGENGNEFQFIAMGAAGATERAKDLAIGDLRQISSLIAGLRALGSRRVLDDVLALVLDSAIDVSGAERGFVMLAGAQARLEFKLGRGRGRQPLAGTVFQTSRRIPEHVFRTGDPRIVNDIKEGPSAELHGATIAMGIRSILCVPLRLMRFTESREVTQQEERRIGVLYLDGRDKGSLDSPVTRTALEALADEAGVAIENTRLYREALEKAQLEQELNIAAEMQRALLPPRQRKGPGYEAVATMRACRAIGGDFFDYLELPDGRVGFVLCDVSGKGAPAALMAAMIQGVFRALAEDTHTPADALTRVNQVLSRRAVEGRYATCFYGILAPDGRFSASNAGHNPPILARRDGTVYRLEKGGAPLALFPNSPPREQEELTLGPGDTLVMFSDGLSEAENSDLQQFGEDQLVKTVAAERHREPDALLELLLTKTRDFAGSQAQSDDITALVVRCS